MTLVSVVVFGQRLKGDAITAKSEILNTVTAKGVAIFQANSKTQTPFIGFNVRYFLFSERAIPTQQNYHRRWGVLVKDERVRFCLKESIGRKIDEWFLQNLDPSFGYAVIGRSESDIFQCQSRFGLFPDSKVYDGLRTAEYMSALAFDSGTRVHRRRVGGLASFEQSIVRDLCLAADSGQLKGGNDNIGDRDVYDRPRCRRWPPSLFGGLFLAVLGLLLVCKGAKRFEERGLEGRIRHLWWVPFVWLMICVGLRLSGTC
jgi:hypothetical protein